MSSTKIHSEHKDLTQKFADHLIRGCDVEPGQSGIIAVSGGADSTFLALLFSRVRQRFALDLEVVSIDHGLRSESSSEQHNVRELCKKLDIPFFSAKVDTRARAISDKISVEEAARIERFRCLEARRKERQSDWIALGHTKTDQAETVLLRLKRGTGLEGLSCISPRREKLIRPLLWVAREEIRCTLLQTGMDWIEDPMNDDPAFERSRMRKEILPELNEQVLDDIARLAAKIRKDLGKTENSWLNSHSYRSQKWIYFPEQSLLKFGDQIISRLIRRGMSQLDGGRLNISRPSTSEIVQFCRGQKGSNLDLRNYEGRRVSSPSAGVVMTKREPSQHDSFVNICKEGSYRVEELGITVDVGLERPRSPIWGIISSDEPFVIRSRLPGDRLGSNGKKLKSHWNRYGVWRNIRDWVPLVARGHTIEWTGVRPIQEGRGTLVSIQLDENHPLRNWLRFSTFAKLNS